MMSPPSSFPPTSLDRASEAAPLLDLVNMLLTGASLGASLFGVFICLKGGRATWSWAVTFAFITIFAAVAWFTFAPWGGPLVLTLWFTLVGVPIAALRRSVRAITLESFDEAERFAAWAARFHPSPAGRLQVPLTRLMRRLDNGDVEHGLAELHAVHEAHPELGAWCEADDMRFKGDWEGVRAWMESELDDTVRHDEMRHALPYLLSLAETNDPEAVVDAYERSSDAFTRLRGWGLSEMAQLVVAVTCALRDNVEALLGGPLDELPAPTKQLVRETLRMAEGDIEGGRAALRQLRPSLNYANQLIVDRRLRLDPTPVSPELQDRARFLLSASEVPLSPSRWKRFVRVTAIIIVVMLVAIVWAPWRRTASEGIDDAPLRYIERIVGEAGEDDALPLLVVLHGYGSVPEEMGAFFSELTTPARVVLPAGVNTAGIGRSWFDHEPWEEHLAQFDLAVEHVAYFADTLAADRPTLGTPVVVGFSQGGMLSFALPARHPNSVAAAFPVAGFLDESIAVPPAARGAPPIRAFHGEIDPLITIADARDTVRRLRAFGYEVSLSAYAGLEHNVNELLVRDLAEALDEALATEAAVR